MSRVLAPKLGAWLLLKLVVLNNMFFFLCLDPVYVAYHDEEWGVPVHDDK